ncbi:hypothetical protein [Phyllobacterium phragmitis]|nr:hypothetical protein [Phyllobacterium phragmitis]
MVKEIGKEGAEVTARAALKTILGVADGYFNMTGDASDGCLASGFVVKK